MEAEDRTRDMYLCVRRGRVDGASDSEEGERMEEKGR